jgi:hypothetical protein
MNSGQTDLGGLPRKQNDELLKGVFEENVQDFLHFMYPNAKEIFDFDRGFSFKNKELFKIIPDRERSDGKRIADLLAKVYLRDGTEKWIMVHTEIEGGNSSDFAHRIFQYHYRIRDKFDVPVETIAVFTGDRKQRRPCEYLEQGIHTSIHFKYLSFQIFDNSATELLDCDNIFAYIVVACQKALLEGKVAEEELAADRSTIVRALLASKKYDKERIMHFLFFLKSFIFIQDETINNNFDSYIYQVSGGAINMGVIEIIKKQEREAGMSAGLAAGIEKGRLEERAKIIAEKRVIALEFKKMGLPFADIAKGTGLSIAEIEKL